MDQEIPFGKKWEDRIGRRALVTRAATVGGIAGIGVLGYIGLGSEEAAAAELGEVSISDSTIETADGRIASLEVEIDAFEIKWTNVTNQESIGVELRLTENSPTIESDRTVISTTVSIPDEEGTPNGEVTVNGIHGETFDLTAEEDMEDSSLDAEEFSVDQDGESENFELWFQVIVNFSNHSDLDNSNIEDFDTVDTALVTIENDGADADAGLTGSTGGEPETESDSID